MKQAHFTRRVVLPTIAAALGAAIVADDANAISRYVSTSMTCAAAKAKVRAEGAVILQWASRATGNRRFDRFVRNTRYCTVGEITEIDYIPTADRQSCAVRKCVPRSFFDDDDDFFLLWPR